MWYLLTAYSVITGGESVHSRGQGGEVGAAERRHLSGPGLSAAPIVTWLLDRFGPIQLSGLSNLMLAMTQIPMARNAAKDLGQAMRPRQPGSPRLPCCLTCCDNDMDVACATGIDRSARRTNRHDHEQSPGPELNTTGS